MLRNYMISNEDAKIIYSRFMPSHSAYLCDIDLKNMSPASPDAIATYIDSSEKLFGDMPSHFAFFCHEAKKDIHSLISDFISESTTALDLDIFIAYNDGGIILITNSEDACFENYESASWYRVPIGRHY